MNTTTGASKGVGPTQPSRRTVHIPAQFAFSAGLSRNPIRQLLTPPYDGSATVVTEQLRDTSCEAVQPDRGHGVLVIPRKMAVPEDDRGILIVPTGRCPATAEELDQLGRTARWSRPTPVGILESQEAGARRCLAVLNSWSGRVSIAEEERAGSVVTRTGLRPPQVGALYAALAHWTTTTDPATIVMPTGTGKTETMLALLAKERIPSLLVIVPTDPLRDQMTSKFLNMGLLKEFGVLTGDVQYPVVGTLRHKLKSAEEAEEFFTRCNVVISTMSIAGGCEPSVQEKMAALSSHLFIDEAHHVTATTWRRFREHFLGKPILQFTATPFRRDRRPVGGKVVYNYPLRKAQAEGYFKPIKFRSVTQFDPQLADEEIASKAIDQLESDIQAKNDHLLMARADNIKRAVQVHELYSRVAKKHNPLLIHSEQSPAERASVLKALLNRSSRVVVCVDMFGEGFDLPELKVAALHDMHKSLAITLQFTGRFTRSKPAVGDATVVANIADANVEEALRTLYSEDSDWNILLQRLSEGATGKVVRKFEFLARFSAATPDIAVQNIFPKMSAVVYQTESSRWLPHKAREVFGASSILHEPAVNEQDKVLVLIAREVERVPWGDVLELENVSWHLYLLHWDSSRNLLFINSSNTESNFEDLAKAVCGDTVSLLRGEVVFRCLTGLRRILFMNLGLTHSLSRAIRFTMIVGPDILEGLAQAQTENKAKSNIFGRGYEGGERTSVGCSRNGRVWAHRVADDIDEWVQWCHGIGTKLLNKNASFDSVMPYVIKPQTITSRPSVPPVSIEWSEVIGLMREHTVVLEVRGDKVPLIDVGLELTEFSATNPLKFRVFTATASVEYQIDFSGAGDKVRIDYVPVDGGNAYIRVGKKRMTLPDWFQDEPPVLRFSDGSFLVYAEWCEVNTSDRKPFDPTRIAVWDWTGIDLSKESQTTSKEKDSIQYRVIQAALADTQLKFDIVFDDDTTHEAADVVAIAVVGERLVVHLYHCKFSSEQKPGARVEDLYAVCGQAQRCVSWKSNMDALLVHMAKRDAKRKTDTGVSRFERGNAATLQKLRKQAPFLTPDMTAFVVQPGLSRAKCREDHLELLATTELYLKETYAVGFGVIASA